MSEPTKRHPHVVNQDEVAPDVMRRGRMQLTMRRLGTAAGSVALGARLHELEPGTRSFPRHWHCANEEAVYVLSGRGTAILGDDRIAVRAGDWIALPAGRADLAHYMDNDGDERLVYLVMSTMVATEVVVYPDSNKVGVAGADVAQTPPAQRFGLWHLGTGVDYFDGEPEA